MRFYRLVKNVDLPEGERLRKPPREVMYAMVGYIHQPSQGKTCFANGRNLQQRAMDCYR